MADYGLGVGLERATGNLAATGMRLMEFQQNKQRSDAMLGMEGDRLKLAQEQGDREKKAFEHAEKKRVEQETIENAIVPASFINPKFNESPKVRQSYIDAIKSGGFDVKETPDGEVYAPNKAFDYLKGLMTKNHEFIAQVTQQKLDGLMEDSAKVATQIAELQSSGKADEKTLAPLLQQQQAYKTQIASILTVQPEVIKQVEIAKAKSAGESPTDNELYDRSLKGDQQAAAILKAKQKDKLDYAEKNRAIIGGGGFATLDQPTKDIWFEQYEQSGKIPPFASRDAESRNAFTKGYAEYLKGKGITSTDVFVTRATKDAQRVAFKDLEKRDVLQNIFINKIDENSKTIERLAKSYGNKWNRVLNVPVNKANEFLGSGDFASLKLALKSTSNEIAKVESGSLGIAEVSTEQAKYMEKIHDENLTVGEMVKVLNMGRELGKNAKTAMSNQKKDLQAEMSGKKPKESNLPKGLTAGW